MKERGVQYDLRPRITGPLTSPSVGVRAGGREGAILLALQSALGVGVRITCAAWQGSRSTERQTFQQNLREHELSSLDQVLFTLAHHRDSVSNTAVCARVRVSVRTEHLPEWCQCEDL